MRFRHVRLLALLAATLGVHGAGNLKPQVVVGIFGGMGPAATADCYAKVVAATPANRDQDHLATLIYSLPQVPDRTTAIRTGDRTIVPWLVEGVTRLEQAGASFIIIPCNTAHYYHADMQAAVRIPVLNMVELTARETRRQHPNLKTVGVLATTGTLSTGLYARALEAEGFRVMIPEDDVQAGSVMPAIAWVKRGGHLLQAEQLLAKASRHLVRRGAQVIVLGCTETPLAFNPHRIKVPSVDATRVLAEAAVAKARQLQVRPRAGGAGPTVSDTPDAGGSSGSADP